MISTTPSGQGGENGLSTHLLAFIASAAGYLRARLELAGIEGREAAALYIKVGALLAAALLLLAFGYAFLWIGVMALIASFLAVHWGWIVLGVGVLHLAAVAACAWGVKILWKTGLFSATLEEFRKDQEWLNRHK